ncbi:carbohydrate ABC transporter permease [Kiritimatiella glycovorans]|uniref:Sugar transport system permease protein n=1 Tax=Kiritimatiella glycovorans TaxID=1307763 RepID=A0A0G3EHF8_9BACT|nr:carbohydrate ABC transporter permease [Kiritimatiella glycovorans]AKJ63609.1 sugar transport system permease protein [Kiritimatiella glycovorans]
MLKEPDIKARRMRRFRGVLRTVVLYTLLIGGSALFTVPFVWMIGSSFKVDREMFTEELKILPRRPIPAKRSPYLDARTFSKPEEEVFARARPMIEEILAARPRPEIPMGVIGEKDADELLLPGVFHRLFRTMPLEDWDLSDGELHRRLDVQITPDLLADVAEKARRRLLVGPVRVRSIDLQEKELTEGLSFADFWSVAEGPAELRDARDGRGAVVHYDFSAPGKQRVVLTRRMSIPFEVERLQRLMVAITPDDSWHDLRFEMEMNGRLYRTTRDETTGRIQSRIITLQEHGPADAYNSTRMRLWTPYKQKDSGPEYESRPRTVKLSMIVDENGALGAWGHKLMRNYRKVFDYVPFWQYVLVSVVLLTFNIVGAIFSCSLVAYAFARLEWPGRKLCFAVMLATLMIPPQVTMVPYFLIVKNLGWYNTLTPLWVLNWCANAFNTFLLIQFMRGIPKDLEDSAVIDGCNFLQVYWYVIMPLVKPTLACIAIFTFMAVWNDFMGPLIFISDQQLYPLPLGLYALQVERGTDFGLMMAGSLLMTLPVIVVFFFAQKYFIQGIALTGMKG